MANIYCGNNANHPGLIGGAQILGNRYQCLQKGIGVGRNLPPDQNYLQPYVPINQTRSYCGNTAALPGGYNRMGELHECYTKGVGLGKAQRAQQGLVGPVPQNSLTLWSLNLLFIGIFIIIFLLLYFLKPSFVIKENENSQKEIDMEKFIPDILVIALILLILRYLSGLFRI